ncbi:MAG: thiolase family protein [Rhizobacter sp.]|nr:thiolase family protein [Rhizobacter sp.]
MTSLAHSSAPSAVIAGYARTPFHFAKKGRLVGVRPDDLAATAVKGLIERTQVNPHDIEDLILGCSYPEGEQGSNMARLVVFLAGLPVEVAGTTVNRFCGSAMTAIHIAAGQIAIGAGEVFVCGGVESMTRVPDGGFNPSPNPALLERFPQAYMKMGETAEVVAERYAVSRVAQEELSVESHHKAAAAQELGRLHDEIVPVTTPEGVVDRDGCIRPTTSMQGLAGLKLAFREPGHGTVTAGTSSPLTDGATAVLVCSEDYARRTGLPILARIRATAVAGCPPEEMGMGPVPAVKKALARAGLTVADLDLVEINEAFSSQAVACLRELGIEREKINLDGGGLSIGHPLGATGARLVGKAATLLQREGKRYALATQCIGGGQGIATVLEAVG